MEYHPQFVDDPRIMKPLEEFLRTVREVVESPHPNEEQLEKVTVVSLFPKKKTRGFTRWW